MSEKNSTQTVRGHVLALPGKVDVQRIEDKMSPGIPDMNVCWNGIEFWLEGKFIKDLPARDDTLVRFGSKDEPRLAHQANWLENRQRAGGKCFVWIRVRDDGWYFWRDDFRRLVNGVPKHWFTEATRYGSAKEMVAAIGDLVRQLELEL